MAPPTTVITINKDMTYRGVPGEVWSNTYMLTGATPADSTAWKALFDAIVLEEKKCYTGNARVIGGYGYDKVPAKGDHAIWSVDLRPSSATVLGTLAISSFPTTAGDQACWLRWSLNRYTSKGKRVYLRKYFHNGISVLTVGDNPAPAWRTALDGFGTFMMGATVGGSRTLCDRLGNTPIASTSGQFMTTRTLKRRSKRPDPS